MPFKSQAQRRKIAQLEREGKVKKGTTAAWEKETPAGKLPERVGKPRRRAGKEPQKTEPSYIKGRFGIK